MKAKAILAAVLLTGCATVSVPEGSGREATIQHNPGGFNDATKAMMAHCGEMGLRARHVQTEPMGVGFSVLSRFECVTK